VAKVLTLAPFLLASVVIKKELTWLANFLLGFGRYKIAARVDFHHILLAIGYFQLFEQSSSSLSISFCSPFMARQAIVEMPPQASHHLAASSTARLLG